MLENELVKFITMSKVKLISCTACNYKAKSEHTLRVHIEMNHIQLRFHCQLCHFGRKERYKLKDHLTHHFKKHMIKISPEKVDLLHKCYFSL